MENHIIDSLNGSFGVPASSSFFGNISPMCSMPAPSLTPACDDYERNPQTQLVTPTMTTNVHMYSMSCPNYVGAPFATPKRIVNSAKFDIHRNTFYGPTPTPQAPRKSHSSTRGASRRSAKFEIYDDDDDNGMNNSDSDSDGMLDLMSKSHDYIGDEWMEGDGESDRMCDEDVHDNAYGGEWTPKSLYNGLDVSSDDSLISHPITRLTIHGEDDELLLSPLEWSVADRKRTFGEMQYDEEEDTDVMFDDSHASGSRTDRMFHSNSQQQQQQPQHPLLTGDTSAHDHNKFNFFSPSHAKPIRARTFGTLLTNQENTNHPNTLLGPNNMIRFSNSTMEQNAIKKRKFN